MGLLSPKISLKIFTTIPLLILFKSRCCHAQAASKSSGNMTAGEKLRATELLSQQKWHVEQINLFLVTLPCLLLFSFVFACYVCIWKTQRLHGWIVLAITGSLALRFGVIFLMDLPKFYFHYKPFLCVTYGVMHHLFFFMCYCWALVQAFDLWRRVRTAAEIKGLENEKARFLAYAAVGFGVPILIVTLAGILEWGVSDSVAVSKPQYNRRCRVVGESYIYFVTIPSGILIVANLGLLSSGCYYLWLAKKMAGGAGGSTGRGMRQKNFWAELVVKNFVLMGGLVIADFAIHYTGLYDYSPYWNVPIEFVCRVGYALGFIWVFVFGGTAKEQLRRKFPDSFGHVYDAVDKSSRLEGGRNETNSGNATSVTVCQTVV